MSNTFRRQKQMHLSISIQSAGYHRAGWRLESAPNNPDTNIAHYIRLAKLAEDAKFDLVFFADHLGVPQSWDNLDNASRLSGVGKLEPITALSAISTHTSYIGLGGTISTSFNEPYNVARIVASLDHISGGRACWNVVTSSRDIEARNFGANPMLEHEFRYRRAREFVSVVRGLWDTYDDGAFLRDKESGIYFDPEKAHVLDHKGEHFSVLGPLNVETPPQRYPVLAQAGFSETGKDFAAEIADIVYGPSISREQAQSYRDTLKARLATHGRKSEDLKILTGIMPIVGRTEAEAQEKLEYLGSLIDEKVGRALLAGTFGDLEGLPVDQPIPNPPRPEGSSSREYIKKLAYEGATIRQLYQFASARGFFQQPTGTPEQLADFMQAWFEAGISDGFNLLFHSLPEYAEDFIELVVPILKERGLFRTEYTGVTLRDHLGLSRPGGRHPR